MKSGINTLRLEKMVTETTRRVNLAWEQFLGKWLGGLYPSYQPCDLPCKNWTQYIFLNKKAAHKSRTVINCSFSLLPCSRILIQTSFLYTLLHATHSCMEHTDVFTKEVTQNYSFEGIRGNRQCTGEEAKMV